jgi:hypothetical protein
MTSGKSKKNRSSSKDRSLEDVEVGHEKGFDDFGNTKKKHAKDRKRELESMYGSQPLPQPPERPTNTRLASSLPTDLDKELSTSEGKNKKSKSSKTKNVIAELEENEQSFQLHDLVKRRPNMPRAESKKRHSIAEQSFAVDDLVVLPERRKPPEPSKSESVKASFSDGRRGHLQRAHSGRPQLSRGRSTDRSQTLHSRQSSRQEVQRMGSQSQRTRSLSRTSSSRRGRSIDRAGSVMGYGEGSTKRGMSKQGSRPTLTTQYSSRPALNSQLSRSRSVNRSRHGNVSGSILFDGTVTVAVIAPGPAKRAVKKSGRSITRFIPGKNIEEKPSRSIVLVWLIVAAELGFDLGTTIIAFRSFLEDDSCCGSPISLG